MLPQKINDKAAFRRPVGSYSNTKKILERAKGLEPSTPTLARSCSTTELHPHPNDWRRSLAGNGRAMPNAAYECNSRHEGRNGPKIPISPDMSRNRPETAGERPLARPATGTLGER